MDSDLVRIAAGPLSASIGAGTEIIEGIPLSDVGLAGLVTLFVLLILTGRLIPKSTVERENALLQAQLTESRESGAVARTAALELIKASSLDAESIRDLSSNAQVNIQLAELVKSIVDERGAGGGS